MMTSSNWRRSFGLGLAGLGLLCVLIGVVGRAQGRAALEAALANASPEVQEELRQAGTAEAQIPLRFGMMAGAGPLVAGAVVALIGLVRKPAPRKA